MNRARYMPQNPYLIATKSITAEVNVFDWSKHPSKPKADGTFEPAVPTLLVKGHTADVNAIDVHPTREYLFCSAALSDIVYLWDANLRSLVGQVTRLDSTRLDSTRLDLT